jgi:hypothetical protein
MLTRECGRTAALIELDFLVMGQPQTFEPQPIITEVCASASDIEGITDRSPRLRGEIWKNCSAAVTSPPQLGPESIPGPRRRDLG